MGDVFCIPLAHSMARSLASGWIEIAVAIFCGTAAAGLPTLMRTIGYLAEEPIARKEEKSNE